MRKGKLLGAIAAGTAFGVAASVAGCFDSFATCDPSATCAAPDTADAGDGGVDPACVGDPTLDPALVNDRCGVFVSAKAAPGGDGTRARPLQRLSEAAAKSPARLYVCADEYAESAGVQFTRGVEIFAGFADCASTWRWSNDARGKLLGPADAIALVLDGGEHRVENLDVVAADATLPGGSSIGLLVNGGALAMRRSDVTAGAGRDAEDGESLEADMALDGVPGNAGNNACVGDLVLGNPGGAAATKMCGDTVTAGGKGGDGGNVQVSPLVFLAAGAGGAGEPEAELGQGGAGEPVSGVWSCAVGAGRGGANSGAPGGDGAAGSGAGESTLGTLSRDGFVGAAGAAGAAGKPGQGGGGGGGAKGGRICTGGTSYGPGASGGSGGTGGCGGTGGGGGRGGGASVAVVSLGAQVTLETVELTAKDGGRGSNGGKGQPGGLGGIAGPGGQPSSGSKAACPGGLGGQGGNGGSGGGGRGGHSVGIAYTGPKPAGAVIHVGVAGNGGDGGPGNEIAGKAAAGVAAEMQAFE